MITDMKAYMREWRRNNPNYMIEKGKEFRIKNPTYDKIYKKNNYERKKKYESKTGMNKAISKLHWQITIGNIIDLKKEYVSCSYCDKRAIQYDHRDYNKPLEVMPVCQSCNKKLGCAIPCKV